MTWVIGFGAVMTALIAVLTLGWRGTAFVVAYIVLMLAAVLRAGLEPRRPRRRGR